MNREAPEVKDVWQEYQAVVLRQGVPQAMANGLYDGHGDLHALRAYHFAYERQPMSGLF
jgi:hypothetical protein